MSKILLTGASGAIGLEILKQFKAKGELDHLSVLVRDSRKNRKKMQAFPGLEVHYGDVTDVGSVMKAVKNKDIVIHLAALIPTVETNHQIVEHVNINGTKNVVEAMEKECPDAFLLFSSSVAIYGDRISDPYIQVGDPLKGAEHDHYAQTKVIAEKIIQKSSLTWSILRLTAIMGIGNHKINPLMFEMPLNTPMEIATVRDTARAFVHAVEKTDVLKGRIYNLSGGESCRILFSDFLTRAFNHFGLGKPNFPDHTFATQNFHCGYYKDADQLEEILAFRRDTIESYFERFRKSVPAIQRWVTRPFAWIVKLYLRTLSEPLRAYKTGDEEKIKYYFGNHDV